MICNLTYGEYSVGAAGRYQRIVAHPVGGCRILRNRAIASRHVSDGAYIDDVAGYHQTPSTLFEFTTIYIFLSIKTAKMAAAATLNPVFPAGPVGQPDIAYAPNWDTYQARAQRRVEEEKLAKALPDGFPTKLQSELVWDGATVSDRYQWWYKLTESDIAEVDSALQHFKSKLRMQCK